MNPENQNQINFMDFEAPDTDDSKWLCDRRKNKKAPQNIHNMNFQNPSILEITSDKLTVGGPNNCDIIYPEDVNLMSDQMKASGCFGDDEIYSNTHSTNQH